MGMKLIRCELSNSFQATGGFKVIPEVEEEEEEDGDDDDSFML